MNTICANIGVTDFLKNIGLVNKGTQLYSVPDKSRMGEVHDRYDQYLGRCSLPDADRNRCPDEYFRRIRSGGARMDGASGFQIFRKITMPYMLFVTGPALITDFVKNINNFNVIYLLTQDVFVTSNQALANSNAKEVDLLVTWLFRLTNEYYNYKMASVIGICVFVICAAFTLVTFTRTIKGDKEDEFR